MKPIWLKGFSLLAVLAIVAVACGDDDDDTAATSGGTTATAAAGATTTAAGASTATTGTGGTATTAAAGAATDNPHSGDAKDAADFISRLSTLLPSAEKYSGKKVAQVTGTTTQGVTDTTIKVGSVTGVKSASGVEPFSGDCEGAMARLELENSKGGVKSQDGKTRKFEWAGTKDDKGRYCQNDNLDRDLSRQKIKDMVEGDKVFALLPITSNGFFSGDYLNEKHIPYFGFAFQLDYCGPEHPFAFGVNGTYSCDALGDHVFVSDSLSKPLFTALGVDAKGKKVALAGDASAASTTGNTIVKSGFEAVGATVVTVDNSIPDATAPLPTDFIPYVNKLLENKPDVIVLVTHYAAVEPLAKALKDAGFKGVIQQFVYESEGLAAAAANFPGIDGSYAGNPGIGAPVGTGKGLTDVRAALDAIGFKDRPITTNTLYGWGAADMLITMIQEAPGPLSTESITNYANKGWGYKGYGDVVCPASWPIAHYIGSPCLHVVQLDLSGALGATNGLGINGGKGGMLAKVSISLNNLFIIEKPK